MPTAGMGRVPATLGRQFGKVRRPTSLGAKLVLIMTAVALCGTVAITVLLAAIFTPNFTKLEKVAIASRTERASAMLSDYAAKIETAARDDAEWGDRGRSVAIRDHDFGGATVDGVAHVAADGRIVAVHWDDRVRGIGQAGLRDYWDQFIRRTNFAAVLGDRRSARFYAWIGPSLAAIGVAHAQGPDGEVFAPGYVVMARVITARQMSDALRLDATIHRGPAVAEAGLGTTTTGTRTPVISVPMLGANGISVATAQFPGPGEVPRLSRRMLMLSVTGSTVLLILILIVLRRLITRLVLRPLRRIENHMRRVRASGSLALLEEDERRDEIGSLGRNFNAMLRQLKDLREQIGVQSFDLGRTESAVAVMHNVRNALNPISTILSREIAQAPPIDRATLDRAIEELARGDVSDERRQKLAAFVTAAVDADAANRESTRHELSIGREAMGHVLEIIGQQQQGAHERPALEICDITAIIARNATIVRYLDGASIAFGFPAGPNLVMANRLILSQVIGNLFANAAESIVARGTGSGSIVTAIEQADGRVTIEIRDDGEGITPEVAATLFHRGFSTRAHKSGGLGLHWCANSANAMQGSLRLESEGPGQGAVAILTLLAPDAGVVELV